LINALLLGGFLGCTASNVEFSRVYDWRKDRVELVVHYITNWSAQISPYTDANSYSTSGGVADLAGKLELRRSAATRAGLDSMFFVVGDSIFGTSEALRTDGLSSLKLLNKMSVTAMLPGTLDFNLGHYIGHDIFLKRLEKAKFPIVVSNLKMSNSPFKKYLKIKSETLNTQLWVFGVLPADFTDRLHPQESKLMLVKPPLESIEKLLSRTTKSDVVIVMSGCGLDTDVKIAGLDLVDMVIGTRETLDTNRPIQSGQGYVVTAGYRGNVLGETGFTRRGRRESLEYKASTTIPIEENSKHQSLRIVSTIEKFDENTDQNDRLAVSLLDLKVEYDVLRRTDVPIGNLIADAMRASTGAEVALINSGAIRRGVLSGGILKADLGEMVPFPNDVYLVQMKGKQLYQMIQRSLMLRQDQRPQGGFLQVSGVAIKENEKDGRVSISIDGTPLDSNQIYSIALTDFLFYGGDGYERASRVGAYNYGGLKPILEAYLREIKWVEPDELLLPRYQFSP